MMGFEWGGAGGETGCVLRRLGEIGCVKVDNVPKTNTGACLTCALKVMKLGRVVDCCRPVSGCMVLDWCIEAPHVLE